MWEWLYQFLKDHGGKILGGIITPAIAYKIYNWVIHLFRQRRLENIHIEKNKFQYQIEELGIVDFMKNILEPNQRQGSLLFYECFNIFQNQGNKVILNGIEVPAGFGTFEIEKSKNQIRLNIYENHSTKYKYAFIYKNNNIDTNNCLNIPRFERILLWKNMKIWNVIMRKLK